jgi:ribosomal protein S18 acetylase RimI-like enzyme
MAALSDVRMPQLLDLRQLHAGDLDPLLEEEIGTWKRTLDWDFRASAGLVRRFVEIQALSGYALVANGRLIGYSYYVCEDHKGLIGDVYVMRQFANADYEGRLLTSVVETLFKTPQVRRVESQLMMLRSPGEMAIPLRRYLRAYGRNFMEIALDKIDTLPAVDISRWTTIDSWTERRQDDAAALIPQAYHGHIDSEINDQYRSPAGARRFLMNIVQFPGCGSFFAPASFVTLDPATGRVSGLCLASLVAPDVGHITQICVGRSLRGKGIGYELLRRSLVSLARHQCRKASLTVTASNEEAIRVYQRMGFFTIREFAAWIWDGF